MGNVRNSSMHGSKEYKNSPFSNFIQFRKQLPFSLKHSLKAKSDFV